MKAAAVLLLALSGIGSAYLLAAALLVLRGPGRAGREPAPPLPPGRAPAVTILKPLHGAEPELLANLRSFAEQDYPGAVRIVLGVQSETDGAIAVAEQLRAACPDRAIDLVIDPRQHGGNRKVSNLVNMAATGLAGEIVVLADSDMRVPPDYLRRLVGALEEPGVGAVTCLYHGVPAGTVPSRLAALGIDAHFLPGVVVGLALGLARPCMGSTIALPLEVLERIGGFAVLADALADDYELGAAVRRLGLRVAVPPFSIGHLCPERDLRALLRQELRWARTVRGIDPAGHAGSLVGHPLAFALAALALWPGPLAAAAAFTAFGARVALCLAVERAFGLKPHPYGLVPVRDLLSAGVFLASFLGRGVSWRGHRFDVRRSGALVPKVRPDPT